MEVSYLGYKLKPQGITQGINKLKVLADARPLNNVHEVRQVCATSPGDMSKTFEFVNRTTQSEVIAFLKIKNFLKIFEI